MTGGLRKAKRSEESARPAFSAASFRLRFSHTMRSSAVFSLPVTAPRRERPSIAAAWRVGSVLGSEFSDIGNCPHGRRVVAEVDDIAGLHLDIDAERWAGGG